MTSGAGVLVLQRGHVSHIVKVLNLFKILCIDHTKKVNTSNDDQGGVYKS